jgi:single-strand DNA-binding protein
MFNDKFTVSVKGNIGFMETKNLPSGTQVTNFTLAINESYKDRSGQVVEETNYANCSAYAKTSELMERFCKVGTRLLLENQPVKFGKDPQTNKPNGRLTVVVQTFEVLRNGKPKENNQNQQNGGRYQQRTNDQGYGYPNQDYGQPDFDSDPNRYMGPQ